MATFALPIKRYIIVTFCENCNSVISLYDLVTFSVFDQRSHFKKSMVYSCHGNLTFERHIAKVTDICSLDHIYC
jgi:hypothetical protein